MMSKSSKFPVNSGGKQQKTSVLVGSHYSGPVPPPEIMEKLDKILPGSAERIFIMAEKEQEAVIADREQTQNREDRRLKNAYTENLTALWMAFIICLVFVGCGTYLVINGHENTGLALLGTTLVAIISSFLYRWKKSK